MKPITKILSFTLLLALSSCVTPKIGGYKKEANMLYPGMPKSELISKLGKPQSTSFRDGKYIMRYTHPGAQFLGVPWASGSRRGLSVTLENDKVVSW